MFRPPTVLDPLDWRDTRVPEMAEWEAHLRCFVCKELFTAPVLTTCGHTFCLACVRKYIFEHDQCPLCHSEQREGELRRAGVLEEVVVGFGLWRERLLQALRGEVEVVASTGLFSNRAVGESPREPREVSQGSPAVETPKKRSAGIDTLVYRLAKRLRGNSAAAVPTRTEMVECPVCEELMTAAELQGAHIDLCLLGEGSSAGGESGGGVPGNGSVAALSPSSLLTTLSREASVCVVEEVAVASALTEPVALTGAAALIRLATPAVLTGGGAAPADAPTGTPTSTPTGAPTAQRPRLPRLDYPALSTTKLKEKLAQVRLPTNGARAQLEARYNEYYLMYNASLDSSRPVLEAELRRRVLQWEHRRGATLEVSAKEFNRREWMRRHREHYRELVAAARVTRDKAAAASLAPVPAAAPSPAATTPSPLAATAANSAANCAPNDAAPL